MPDGTDANANDEYCDRNYKHNLFCTHGCKLAFIDIAHTNPSTYHGSINFREYIYDRIKWAYEYRLNALRNGEDTPILNEILFKGFRAQLGGHIRAILTGGAPLSGECHDYIRVVMGAPVLQGYGLTETTCCATIMDMEDFASTTKVGSPVQGAQIKLVNWEEGGYKVTDKPNPRGEIHIGGSFITDG